MLQTVHSNVLMVLAAAISGTNCSVVKTISQLPTMPMPVPVATSKTECLRVCIGVTLAVLNASNEFVFIEASDKTNCHCRALDGFFFHFFHA